MSLNQIAAVLVVFLTFFQLDGMHCLPVQLHNLLETKHNKPLPWDVQYILKACFGDEVLSSHGKIMESWRDWDGNTLLYHAFKEGVFKREYNWVLSLGPFLIMRTRLDPFIENKKKKDAFSKILEDLGKSLRNGFKTDLEILNLNRTYNEMMAVFICLVEKIIIKEEERLKQLRRYLKNFWLFVRENYSENPRLPEDRGVEHLKEIPKLTGKIDLILMSNLRKPCSDLAFFFE
ncbi:MAG: hypothetical protein JW725_04685 [Candidatus Babeliaceae bacterium]|nr:hypothetical protein [Candidatus Babeliaceae bacterium]